MSERAPRNRTLNCSQSEMERLSKTLININKHVLPQDIAGRIIHQDFWEVSEYLPAEFVDLLIVDPPYNLTKNYNGKSFKAMGNGEYEEWFEKLVKTLKRILKPNATAYFCSDWKTSILIAPILQRYFAVHNRITWEREKGRGATSNWKNNTEDIWFCSVGKNPDFNVGAVKLKRKVIAPYRNAEGKPKDWKEENGGNFRITYPSNIWTDITIPFWSMPENTDHPTQKPEKLIAKLVLASSRPGDFVFDPFLGSGTSAVVCSKLGRKYSGVEQNFEYCCLAQKRLNSAVVDSSIQGYVDGIFWERNSLSGQKSKLTSRDKT